MNHAINYYRTCCGFEKVTYVSVDPTVGTYVSVIIHGRATEIFWFRTYVPGSIPMVTRKFFFINLVIIYWTLNSIYMQFEYQYSKTGNVSIEHVQVLRGMFGICEPREMLRSFAARGV